MSIEWGDDTVDLDRPNDSAEHWSAKISALQAENARLKAENIELRQHIGNIHNRVRHELSAEIEAASDKAFKAMSGIGIFRTIREAEEAS